MEITQPLISTHDLANLLKENGSSPNLRVLDASWHNPLKNRDAIKEYKEQHIVNAGFFDINECADKSSPYSVTLPSETNFQDYVGKLGIDNGTHIVVYDTYNGIRISSRAWWMFRLFGHERVSVLEGGLTKWISDGYEVTDVLPTFSQGDFIANLNASLKVEFEGIYSMMRGGQAGHLIDSRPRNWFFGMDYPEDEKWKSWHIPGSINIPWTEFVNEDKLTLKSREALLALFKSHNIDIMTDPIKSTCRRGIYACAMALAAFAAGREDIPVYDGSWEEFSSRARKEEYMTDK